MIPRKKNTYRIRWGSRLRKQVFFNENCEYSQNLLEPFTNSNDPENRYRMFLGAYAADQISSIKSHERHPLIFLKYSYNFSLVCKCFSQVFHSPVVWRELCVRYVEKHFLLSLYLFKPQIKGTVARDNLVSFFFPSSNCPSWSYQTMSEAFFYFFVKLLQF